MWYGTYMSKTCTKCEQLKPLEDYYHSKSCKDGRQSSCKACHKARARKWKKENPEKARAANRKWRKENPEKARAATLKWQKENPDKEKEKKTQMAEGEPREG